VTVQPAPLASPAPASTYGVCIRVGRHWQIETDPSVATWLKRCFPRIETGAKGEIKLRRSAEVDRNLQWFFDRWPMRMATSDRLALHQGSERHRADERFVADLTGGRHEPRAFSLAVTPREYQRQAADLWLRLRRLLLGDELGLGKTISAITGLSVPETRPALIVAPTHLPMQWEEQLRRCLPSSTIHICRGVTPYDIEKRTAIDAAKRRLFQPPGPPGWPDFVICPYTRLHGWADTLAGRFQSVVADEIQELRHPDTAKYRAFRAISDRAEYVLGLSASPVHNYGGEFFNPLDAVNPGALGAKEEFLREWCTTDYGEGKARLTDPRAFGDHIRRSGLFLRRTRKDVGRDLPPLTVVPFTIDADIGALDRIKSSAGDLAKIILAQNLGTREGAQAKLQAGGELDRIMRQATGIAKAPYIAGFLRMIVESGERVICFAWHKEVYRILAERLEDLAPAFYTGAETPRQKQESLRRLKAGETPILILSLRSGAGIDGLQHICRTAVIAELDWSPKVHDQAIGRVFRDGQPDKVMAYYLIAELGSDPVVADVCGAKAANSNPVVDPDATVADHQIDPNHVRLLAEATLRRSRGG
jgi:SNF2 family DNA or RNA helicase